MSQWGDSKYLTRADAARADPIRTRSSIGLSSTENGPICRKPNPKSCPTEKDFNIATSKGEWDEMKRMLSQCGVDQETAKTMIKVRLLEFE